MLRQDRMTKDEFIKRLEAAAYGDIADYYHPDGRLKRLDQMPTYARRNIKAIKSITTKKAP